MQEFSTRRSSTFCLLIGLQLKAMYPFWLGETPRTEGIKRSLRMLLGISAPPAVRWTRCCSARLLMTIKRQPRACSCHNVQHVCLAPLFIECFSSLERRRLGEEALHLLWRCHKRICHVRAFVKNAAIIGQSPLYRCRHRHRLHAVCIMHVAQPLLPSPLHPPSRAPILSSSIAAFLL